MPVLPTNARLVTKKEIALGALSRPTYRGNSACERYMAMGEVVSFTLAQRNDFNAEFIINGNPNKRIWLSQLNRIFLSADDSKLYSGTINYRDGRRISLGVMSVDDFVNAIKDKRFRVEISNDLYAIDFWNSKCQGLGTCGAIRDYICKALDEERYNDVEGMTKSMTCYSFYEV